MDTISLSTLRNSPYSGLDELVAETPGYYVSSKGKIYSDHCPPQKMRELRRRINHDFYRSRQVLRVMDKFRRQGALRLLPGLGFNLLGSAAGRLVPSRSSRGA